MADQFMLIFIALNILFVMIFLGFFMYTVKNRTKVYQEWPQFAAQNGLTYYQPASSFRGLVQPPPTVSGTFEGRRFEMETYVETSGSGEDSSSTTYHRLKMVMSPNFPGNLTLFKEGFWAKVGKKLGKEDLQLNDEEFDSAFIIRSTHRDLPTRVLDVLTRKSLLEFTKWRFSWENDVAEAERVGIERDAARLTKLCQVMAGIADQIERTYGDKVEGSVYNLEPVED